ncbi:MAG: AGE family epimerase/isomerase [Paludibacteraceae bacterium]|nr:AGE family epimerase/isomerase [Paludibacteraceae bacterium]
MEELEYDYFKQCESQYQSDLCNNILPFWLIHGLDRVNGGFYTCLNRDGSLMDTTKSVWFQGRAAYVFSLAYNNINQNPDWINAAKSTIDFMVDHCFDTDGRMFFEISAEGVGIRKRRYLFSECFAIIAMAEYSKATNDKHYANKALELFGLVLRYKDTPGLLQPKFNPSVDMKGLSLPMILLNTAIRLRDVVESEVVEKQIDDSINEIKSHFLQSEFKALLENVSSKGDFIDSNIGRVVNPGHSIEAAWFIMEEAEHRGNDPELISLATTILDWSWELGWDKEFGGLYNFRDCKGLPPQDYSQDMKFWWPQTEAIIATLYAYKLTGDPKYKEMHKAAHEYTYRVFPDAKYGEWYGYLHRDGTVAQPAKGNLFKGPFHIPRMMMLAANLCNKIYTYEPKLQVQISEV